MISRRPSWNVGRSARPISFHCSSPQRLGGDHQRVDRQQRSVLAVELGRVSLGRPHDDLGIDRAARRGEPARADLLDRGVLEDPRSGGIGSTRDGVREPQRMHGRAVCVCGSPRARRGVARTGAPRRRRSTRTRSPKPKRSISATRALQPLDLGLRAGERDRAAEVACVGDRVAARRTRRSRARCRASPVACVSPRLRRACASIEAEAHRQQGRSPSTVATAGAEADRLAFDHRHPQRRIALEQVPRRPEARQSRLRRSPRRRRGHARGMGTSARSFSGNVSAQTERPSVGDMLLNVGGGGRRRLVGIPCDRNCA